MQRNVMLFSVIPQFRELVFFSSKMEKTKPALKWDISTAPCNRSQIKKFNVRENETFSTNYKKVKFKRNRDTFLWSH